MLYKAGNLQLMILTLGACLLELTVTQLTAQGFKGFDKFEKVKSLKQYITASFYVVKRITSPLIWR